MISKSYEQQTIRYILYFCILDYGKYLPIIIAIGTVVGLFCLFLLFIWCYNNRRSRCRNSSPENRQIDNAMEEYGASSTQRQTSRSSRRSEVSPISLGEVTTSTLLTERNSLQEEDQLPPKYEDIENHPIVTQHSLSHTDTDTVPPPKYEDIA